MLGNGSLFQNSELLKSKCSRLLLFAGENLEPSVNTLLVSAVSTLSPHETIQPHCLVLNRHLAKAGRKATVEFGTHLFIERKLT